MPIAVQPGIRLKRSVVGEGDTDSARCHPRYLNRDPSHQRRLAASGCSANQQAALARTQSLQHRFAREQLAVRLVLVGGRGFRLAFLAPRRVLGRRQRPLQVERHERVRQLEPTQLARDRDPEQFDVVEVRRHRLSELNLKPLRITRLGETLHGLRDPRQLLKHLLHVVVQLPQPSQTLDHRLRLEVGELTRHSTRHCTA